MNHTLLLGAVKRYKNESWEAVTLCGITVYRRVGDVERIGIKNLACYERCGNVAAFRLLGMRIWCRAGKVREICGVVLTCKP